MSNRIPESARHVILSVNPNSGSGKRRGAAKRLEQLLEQAGMVCTVDTDIERVVSAAQESAENGNLRSVVSVGGDGTIALLANRLPPRTPFAILPLGTENLFARYLGLGFSPEKVCDCICAGHYADLDAGRANGRLFLVMASCGFDADVVRQVHSARKGHISHWSYVGPILNAIRKYRFPAITIESSSGQSRKAAWTFVFNAPRYAMNLSIHNGGDATDGLLDVCTFRAGKFFRGLFYLSGVLTRQHFRWRDYQASKESGVTLTAPVPVSYQLDGDPGGELPLVIESVPGVLRMLVPEGFQPVVPGR